MHKINKIYFHAASLLGNPCCIADLDIGSPTVSNSTKRIVITSTLPEGLISLRLAELPGMPVTDQAIAISKIECAMAFVIKLP